MFVIEVLDLQCISPINCYVHSFKLRGWSVRGYHLTKKKPSRASDTVTFWKGVQQAFSERALKSAFRQGYISEPVDKNLVRELNSRAGGGSREIIAACSMQDDPASNSALYDMRPSLGTARETHVSAFFSCT